MFFQQFLLVSYVCIIVQDISNNLETYYNNHKLYKKNHHLFTGWLKETNLKLKAINDDRGSKAALVDKIHEVNVSVVFSLNSLTFSYFF